MPSAKENPNDHASKAVRRPRVVILGAGFAGLIGRYSAIGDIHWPFRAHWSRLIASLTWLAVHITILLSFRNRLAVFLELASPLCLSLMKTG